MRTLAARAPERADAEAIAALLARVAAGPTETAEELRADMPSADAWLLEESGALVGFATARPRGSLIADGDLAALPGSERPLVELIEARAADWRTPVLRVTSRGAATTLDNLGYHLSRTLLRLGAETSALVPPDEQPAQLVAVEPTDPRLHVLDQRCYVGSWGFFPETYPEWSARIARRPAAPSFVALAAGDPVGGISCTYRYGWGWVRSLVVAPAARGRGVGAQLLAAAASALTTERIGLEVDELNEPARRLYERVGLREVDRERFYEKELPQ